MHSSNVLRNSFIIEEDEEAAAAQAEEEEDTGEEEDAITNANTMSNTNTRASGQTCVTEVRSRSQSPAKKLSDSVHSVAASVASPAAGGDMPDKAFELPFSELVYINLADNQVGLTVCLICMSVYFPVLLWK